MKATITCGYCGKKYIVEANKVLDKELFELMKCGHKSYNTKVTLRVGLNFKDWRFCYGKGQ